MTAPATDHHKADDKIDLGQLLGTLWRGKLWIMFAGFVALMLGGYYAYRVATPMYTATATVVQASQQDPVVDFSGGLGGGVGADQSSINTEIQIFRSRDLLEKLVHELDLTNDPDVNAALRPPSFSAKRLIKNVISRSKETASPVPEETLNTVISEVGQMISVSNIRQTYVYTLTATTRNPEKSALLVNTLADLYIHNQLIVKSESNLAATEWLTDKASQLRIELEDAEAAVKNFNSSTDLINADTLAALNRQVKALRDRLRAADDEKAELEIQITLLNAAATSNDPEQMRAVAKDRTLDRLFEQIAAQPVAGRIAFDTYFQQILDQQRTELVRMGDQIASLQASVERQQAETSAQSDDLIALQQLQREAEASRLLYEYFLSRLKETTVQSGIQTADSRVLSRAVKPRFPSAPRKSMILALSLVLGVVAGAAFVLGREMLQNTFRAAEELEARTGYAVLGQIPKIPARRRAQLLQYLADKPTSIAAEAVRNMRTSVLLSDVDSPPQVIMSTSSIPGEGKTTQSLALAQNLAGLGKSVLLIEGDVRKRVFQEYFKIKNDDGLMAVLEGRLPLKDAVVHEPSLKADVLMSEKPTSNAADIFSSQAFADLIKQVRKEYDYIVIDTPPVLAVPDARIVGKQVDTTLYSVRWDSTTHRQVTQGLKELAQVNVTIAGLVLAQVDQKGLKRYGYGDQAYAYSGYHNN